MIGITFNEHGMLIRNSSLGEGLENNAICYLDVFLKEMLEKETCFYLQLYGTFSKTLIKTTAFGRSLTAASLAATTMFCETSCGGWYLTLFKHNGQKILNG